jgi:NAD+ synthase (glutamine-hydrolysing)
VGCVVALFTATTGKTPRFRVDGGSNAENLALQNIQVTRQSQLCSMAPSAWPCCNL